MPIQMTDIIWVTRPGLALPAGQIAHGITIDKLAEGIPAGKIPATAINGGVTPAAHTHTAGEITDFDAAVRAAQNVPTVSQNATSGDIQFNDGAGNTTVLAINLVDNVIANASFAGTTLTLTDGDPDTPDVTVNLAAFASSYTNNGDGTYTLNSGDGSAITIDISASNSPVEDVGEFFAGTTVELVLQEVGASLQQVNADIQDHEARISDLEDQVGGQHSTTIVTARIQNGVEAAFSAFTRAEIIAAVRSGFSNLGGSFDVGDNPVDPATPIEADELEDEARTILVP